MRRPQMPSIGLAIVICIALLVVGIHWREERYSCHVCRATKEVRTSSLLLWPIRRGQVLSFPRELGPAHQHDWWRYSYAYSNGLAGCLGRGVACHTDGRYKKDH
jgi:hypothetical protein